MNREEAKKIIAALVTLRESATDEQALAAPAIYPTWKEEASYPVGTRVLFDDVLYKCLQAHDAQDAWTPVDAPSLWARILIPDANVVSEWIQPDSTNPYMKGDKVMHGGFTWVSLTDNNVWEPTDAVPTLWEKQ